DNIASRRVLLKNGFTIASALETERDVQHAFSGSSIVAYRLIRSDIVKGNIAVTLQALLDGYSKIYGMPSITLDANGMFRLCFQDIIDIDIEPAKRPGHVHMYTVLGRIPPNADVAWYRMLQEANLFGRDTGFAATACDPTTGEVVLCQLLDVETLTAERFD